MARVIRIKPGCDFTGIHPDTVFWAGVVAGHHLELTGRSLWITSARRPYRPGVISRHSPPWNILVTACDFRRWYLDEIAGRAERFCKMLQKKYGNHLGVVLEPEWLSAREIRRRGGIDKIAPHIHCQTKLVLFDPAISTYLT